MSPVKRFKSRKNRFNKFAVSRLTFFIILLLGFFVLIIYRLFFIQIIQHDLYKTLASNQHEILKDLIPERGEIFMTDRNEEFYPMAQNRDRFALYAVPKDLQNQYDDAVQKLTEYFHWDATSTKIYSERLAKKDDPYEPIAKSLTMEDKKNIESWHIKGLAFRAKSSRFYPSKNITSHLSGFFSFKSGKPKGQYGLEGYFDKELTGIGGQIHSERDAAGRLITVASKSIEKSVDGADIYLTIDQPIQYHTCNLLNQYAERLGASGGQVIVLEPNTGKILAMCSFPNFDPNEYFKQEDISVFNNPIVSGEYEPGSIFKPITMAAALDLELVTPKSTYNDEGCRKISSWPKPLCNSDIKFKPHGHGMSSMTDILDYSLNTGVMWLADKIGDDLFKKYVEGFGFGKLTNITLPGEIRGNIRNLGKAPIYTMTGSFGQGIAVTPIQMVMSYGVIANGGKLMRPYLVDKIVYADGRTEVTKPKKIRQVISESVSTVLSGMLGSVIENGHAERAGVSGYYLAGKTGTAQVASRYGGYSGRTIHSFVGFGPIHDPKFVIFTKLDNPAGGFSASTAAPLFSEIASFILNYYQIPTSR